MSSPRTNFREKLNRIYVALCEYTDDILEWDEAHLLGDIKLRYAIILQAVDDLHFGSIVKKEQEKAIEYFNSEDFKQHCREIPVPQSIINKIIYSPEEYSYSIKYKIEDCEEYEMYL